MINRFRNTIGGARIGPDSSSAGGIWNLGEAAMYRSFYSDTVPSWPSVVVTRGLIGFWNAGVPESYPGTGTTWSDISGNGYTGTLNNGPTFSSNEGGGIVFDGTNDGVSTTFTGSLTTFAIAAWCKPTAIGQSNGSDVAAKDSYGGVDYLSTSKFRYIVFNGASANSGTGANTCAINNIYYVVVNLLDTGFGLSAFGYVNVNGVMTQDANFAVGSYPSTTNGALNIGYYPPSLANNYFTGTIYAVQLYNVTLTTAEIQQNFDAMRGRFSL
jgi:hypothetical protein